MAWAQVSERQGEQMGWAQGSGGEGDGEGRMSSRQIRQRNGAGAERGEGGEGGELVGACGDGEDMVCDGMG